MDFPQFNRYFPQEAKKRVCPESSSSCMEAEVVEIPVPLSFSESNSSKKKKPFVSEVIDVDIDEDDGDFTRVGMQVNEIDKGKEVMPNFSDGFNDEADTGQVYGASSSMENCTQGSHTSFSVDANLSYASAKCLYKFYDDMMHDDDQFQLWKPDFNGVNIPSGVHSVPEILKPSQTKKNLAATSFSASSSSQIQLGDGIETGTHFLHTSCSLGPGQTMKTSSPKSSSIMQLQSRLVGHTPKMNAFSSWLVGRQQNKKPTASCYKNHSLLEPLNTATNLPSEVEPHISSHANEFSYSKKKSSESHSRAFFPNYANLLSIITGYVSGDAKQKVHSSSTYHPTSHIVMPPINAFQTMKTNSSTSSSVLPSVFEDSISLSHTEPKIHHYSEDQSGIPNAGCSSFATGPLCSEVKACGNDDEIMEKFNLFKNFDTVQDYSDHHYALKGSSTKQPPKKWFKKVQEDWKILEKDLPDKIFVRVYESRMDLLRAVIVGAEGTPYHDGLFFFDVFFPINYPIVPPQVYYHSGGLRINPNLYDCGKVCLSLLNTWGGDHEERWNPNMSTMLQVLVSIQGLILNARPYFNEPGYAGTIGSTRGEKNSLRYNENTFILSLKTMVYTMKKPPKNFEDLVVGHFHKYARDVLVSCKAYMDGAQVGCLVKGGVQDVDEGDKSCSNVFKQSLVSYINTLVTSFTNIGAKDCEQFKLLAQNENGPAASTVPKVPKVTSLDP